MYAHPRQPQHGQRSRLEWYVSRMRAPDALSKVLMFKEAIFQMHKHIARNARGVAYRKRML